MTILVDRTGPQVEKPLRLLLVLICRNDAFDGLSELIILDFGNLAIFDGLLNLTMTCRLGEDNLISFLSSCNQLAN